MPGCRRNWQGSIFFFTVVTRGWRPLLGADDVRAALGQVLRRTAAERPRLTGAGGALPAGVALREQRVARPTHCPSTCWPRRCTRQDQQLTPHVLTAGSKGGDQSLGGDGWNRLHLASAAVGGPSRAPPAAAAAVPRPPSLIPPSHIATGSAGRACGERRSERIRRGRYPGGGRPEDRPLLAATRT